MSDSLRPVDCSPPSSSIHGILQARILEWVAIPSAGDLPDPGIKPGSPTLQADPLTSAPPGKPLNTRIQESEDLKDFKGGAEARLKEERGGGRRGGRKGWPYRRPLPPTDTHALRDFSLGLQRREDWNLALPEIRPDQNQNSSSLPRGVISLQSSAQVEGPSTRFLHPGPED